MVAISCSNITKKFNSNTAVSNLSFSVNKGEVFGLLGSNGAGKTTTIKIILGLIKQDNGEVFIDSNLRVGYSPDTPYFHPFLTGYETMEFFCKLQGIKKNSRYAEITKILTMVGLLDARDQRVKGYSKGMLQRLSVAQSLLGSPDILILDEPTAGLDAVGRLNMLNFISNLKNEGKTIILNSHILNDVQRVADRGIIIDKGTLVKEWSFTSKDNGESLERLFIDVIGGNMYACNND